MERHIGVYVGMFTTIEECYFEAMTYLSSDVAGTGFLGKETIAQQTDKHNGETVDVTWTTIA